MRITQSMLNQGFLANINKSNQAMERYQNQLSTGKKISKPSDDPVTAVRGMFYRSSLNEIEQYKRNSEDGVSWMTATDEALNEVTSVLQRVRELTLQGINGTNGDTDKYAIAQEISQLKEHLGEVANSQLSGKYIFAGTDVKNPPYRENIAGSGKSFVNENKELLELRVGQTNSVQINVTGMEIFNNDGNGGIFKVLDNIISAFKSDQEPPGALADMDEQLDHILRERSELGARVNRMELSMSRIDGLELSTTRMLSHEEDVDMTRVIIDLKAQENVQRAALSAGARIIQPSLVDFLR
ncbi:flagellar hook-associated protein FlgL [Bacillus sp. B-jedd]|uniref:flagellar hook-associated protein FlgL n=1 Tax=Bacillus sp. B-jedd TaxID=1476857 RepID=UPI0005157236|nr:flagellar hook-associated protein FlgL [Bacillus sp. B-jedd]CEG25905.1 flagellar hook-associated protein FlgL [Bacillus sp. B-jedd]